MNRIIAEWKRLFISVLAVGMLVPLTSTPGFALNTTWGTAEVSLGGISWYNMTTPSWTFGIQNEAWTFNPYTGQSLPIDILTSYTAPVTQSTLVPTPDPPDDWASATTQINLSNTPLIASTSISVGSPVSETSYTLPEALGRFDIQGTFTSTAGGPNKPTLQINDALISLIMAAGDVGVPTGVQGYAYLFAVISGTDNIFDTSSASLSIDDLIRLSQGQGAKAFEDYYVGSISFDGSGYSVVNGDVDNRHDWNGTGNPLINGWDGSLTLDHSVGPVEDPVYVRLVGYVQLGSSSVPVPEPGTILLLGAGFIGLALMRRKF